MDEIEEMIDYIYYEDQLQMGLEAANKSITRALQK